MKIGDVKAPPSDGKPLSPLAEAKRNIDLIEKKPMTAPSTSMSVPSEVTAK